MKKRKHKSRPKPTKRKVGAHRRKRPSPLPSRPDPVDAMVTAGAEALGLSIDPAWRKSVAFNLRLIMQHAARVDEFALPDEAEPAPIYQA